MNSYNVEEKRINEARQQVYRDFALKYSEIRKSELSDIEKQTQIYELVENTSNAERILRNASSLSEVSTEDRELLGIKEQSESINVDTIVIDTLVSIYVQRAKMPSQSLRRIGIFDGITLREGEELETIDTSTFEEELRQYFTEHYYDLLSVGYNYFLSDVTKVADGPVSKTNGELTEMAIRHNLDSQKFHCFGYQLTIQDGLVAEEDSDLGRSNVFYATPEAINQRVYDLYSKILYQEQKNNSKNYFLNGDRNLKNTYITYAEKNGFELQNRDVLEELPIDIKKVQGIAKYINRILNEKGIISSDMTEKFADEIHNNYSKIMNLSSYNFSELEIVKELSNNKYISELYLQINENSILRRDEFSPDIAYGTPEYIKNEYQRVMSEVARLSHTDAFADGYFEVEKVSKQKEALRRYITEQGIEGIDVSVPNVEVDYQKVEMITDTILNKFGAEYENKNEMKLRILKKVEDRYPEMFSERQTIGLDDLVGEELKDMTRGFVTERLYMQNDFVYIGDHNGFNGECIYATPEAIAQKIRIIDEKISSSDFPYDEKRIREQLVQYAEDNNFKIQIPDIESVENRRQREQDRFSFSSTGLDFFDREMLPDDPTARAKIEAEDTIADVIYKVSEGVPGAIVGIMALVNSSEVGVMHVLSLDDMNIRGSQVWQAYKYLYNEDVEKFTEAISSRDQNMIDFINEELATVGGEKAVIGGASFDRAKKPDKYRFTEEEVEQLKNQREEKISNLLEHVNECNYSRLLSDDENQQTKSLAEKNNGDLEFNSATSDDLCIE